MKKCPKCGHENSDKRRYCENCGEYLYPEKGNGKGQTQGGPKVETVVKTDKKKLFRAIFTTFMITLLAVGGTCLYYMNQMRTEKDTRITKLEKQVKSQKSKINKLEQKSDKSQISYDKEIVKLNKETKSQAKEITKLEKQNSKLQSQLEDAQAQLEEAQSSSKSSDSNND